MVERDFEICFLLKRDGRFTANARILRKEIIDWLTENIGPSKTSLWHISTGHTDIMGTGQCMYLCVNISDEKHRLHFYLRFNGKWSKDIEWKNKD